MSVRRVTTSSFANYFTLFVTYAILSPYLQLYLKARGLSPSRIGVLLGVLELAGVAGPILLGRYADRRHAYRILLAGCFAVAALVFIPMELTTAFPFYVACIVLLGFSYRSVIPLLDSIVSRILPDPAHQYGRLRVAGSFGFIALSLFLQLSGLVTGDSSLSILIAFCASALLAALAAFLLPPAGHALKHSRDEPVGTTRGGFDLRFWAIIGVVFLGRFGLGAYYSFFSLYLKATFPKAGISMLWAIGPLAEIVTIWFSGPLIRRWGITVMLIVSLAAISIRLSLFVIAPTIVVVALAQLLHAFTFGTFHTTAVAYVNQAIVPEKRGLGMAVYNAIGIGLPTFLASAAGGYLLEAHGFPTLFMTYAAVPVLGIAILAIFGRSLVPRKATAPAPRAG